MEHSLIVGLAYFPKLLSCVDDSHRAIRVPPCCDEPVNLNRSFAAEANKLEGWQHFCDHHIGEVFQHRSNGLYQLPRYEQRLYSRELVEKINALVLEGVSITIGVIRDLKMNHIGECSGKLAKHLGYEVSSPIKIFVCDDGEAYPGLDRLAMTKVEGDCNMGGIGKRNCRMPAFN
jgi:hypothetical protein